MFGPVWFSYLENIPEYCNIETVKQEASSTSSCTTNFKVVLLQHFLNNSLIIN